MKWQSMPGCRVDSPSGCARLPNANAMETCEIIWKPGLQP